MRKSIILAVFCLIISAISFAQAPQKMSYQAVVRGSDNNLVVNQNVAMRVSILQGSAGGTAVYTETHSAQTNANGLVSIEIGNGTSNGDFSSIDWASGSYFVKTEIDVNGGTNYGITSVSQLLSVPYAMYAQTTTESQTLADVAALGNSVNAQLKDVLAPTDNQDAATKKYVDDLIAVLQAQNEALQTAILALTTGTQSGHAWVDLGLPSGTKWATCNVGANSPEENGDYFAWGETTPKENYNWSTYRYSNSSSPSLTKYCSNSSYGYNGFTDTLTILEPCDDAATANWGRRWRMPTKSEMQELLDNCTCTWTTQGGVNGCLFTGPNGNSIFLPAAGYHSGSSFDNNGSIGYYWSSSLAPSTVYGYLLCSYMYGNNGVYNDYRYEGRSVRAVLAE